MGTIAGESIVTGHGARVGLIVSIISKRLGFIEEAASFGEAALYHDVGKLMIPSEILIKKGKLSETERRILERHTTLGEQIILDSEIGAIKELAMTVALSHHERWDGSGYPNHLCGDHIPVAAQISSLADCIDALCSKRSYKPAIPLDESLKIIGDGHCGAFSPSLTAYVKSKGVYEDLIPIAEKEYQATEFEVAHVGA